MTSLIDFRKVPAPIRQRLITETAYEVYYSGRYLGTVISYDSVDHHKVGRLRTGRESRTRMWICESLRGTDAFGSSFYSRKEAAEALLEEADL